MKHLLSGAMVLGLAAVLSAAPQTNQPPKPNPHQSSQSGVDGKTQKAGKKSHAGQTGQTVHKGKRKHSTPKSGD
ncbi:MAG TPA: hypothetical protein DEH78_19775 [Solibacterales bacterium]|nr:hypothetical protein [Bryobacterales bacterium]